MPPAPRKLAALALALALLAGCGGERGARATRDDLPDRPKIAVPERAVARRCTRVVDGDTVILDGNERVRLIGVDTPEMAREGAPAQYFALRAKWFTRDLVEGRDVKLAFDYARRDRYGRTLGYLFLDDGTFVNLEIVRQGYGFAYTRFPFRWLEEFRAAESAARIEGAGLWSEPDSLAAPERLPA